METEDELKLNSDSPDFINSKIRPDLKLNVVSFGLPSGTDGDNLKQAPSAIPFQGSNSS